MNRKRTNRLVAIFNIIQVLSIYILGISTYYLSSSIMSGDTGGTSIYNNFIIDLLVNNISLIMIVVTAGFGVINTICAIQNKKNKKLCFWQLIFGLYNFWSAFNLFAEATYINYEITNWLSKILLSIFPIILALINIILIKKRKPKIIQIISYVIVIILSILSFLEITSAHWEIISIIMQLIYIHYQEKTIEESRSRQIINLFLYYILQSLLSIGFLLIILYSLLITKINDNRWKNELSQLYANLPTLQKVATSEICVPVENNYKYGFINENGKEIIPCEYDRVSYFNEIELNNNKYYIALGKKGENFYILSKNNDTLNIDGNLEIYLHTIYEHWGDTLTKDFNKDANYRRAYIQPFQFFFQILNSHEKIPITPQTIPINNNSKEISLTEKNSIFYYTNKNYSMIIEPKYDYTKEPDIDSYYNNYENTYSLKDNNVKYKVTVKKTNGKTQSSIVYLPQFNIDTSTINSFTDGYILFENEDHSKIGWYNSNGNQITIENNYSIKDIKNDKIILQKNTNENNSNNLYPELHYIILNSSGKKILETTALDVYDNIYLVKNSNNKMVLMDKDLNVISNEYDRIITTMQMDISAYHNSYY